MSNLKLSKRPEPPAAAVAAVTAAVDQLSTVLVAQEAEKPNNAWRFSGRHFGPGHAVKYPRRVR